MLNFDDGCRLRKLLRRAAEIREVCDEICLDRYFVILLHGLFNDRV